MNVSIEIDLEKITYVKAYKSHENVELRGQLLNIEYPSTKYNEQQIRYFVNPNQPDTYQKVVDYVREYFDFKGNGFWVRKGYGENEDD